MAAILLLLAPGAALAQNAPAERVAASHPHAGHVADAAQRFRIPEAWIWAVVRVESNGNSRAVSTAGATGLMQIMPGTWAGLRARYRLGSDPFDVRDNIMAGAAYLREMFDRYGNATAMLAAYNAGPGRYDEHLARGRPLPAETRAYLMKLAAITGGSDDTQFAAAPAPDSLAWRRAALFAERSGPASTMPVDAANDARAAQPGRPLAGRTEVAMVAATPPSTGLFVPLSGRSPP
nr:lytic transglycosylase domain-containing protein [Sphingobium baderi]